MRISQQPLAIYRRSIVWLQHWKKTRPAVVLEVQDDKFVIYVPGSTQDRESDDVFTVCSGTLPAQKMGLSETTYFQAGTVAVAKMNAVESVSGQCPIDLFVQLFALCKDPMERVTNQLMRELDQQGRDVLGPEPEQLGQVKPG